MGGAGASTKCREFEGFIDPYLDGEFEARECSEIEAHLDSCSHCRDVTAARAHLKSLIAQARAVNAPDALHARIRADIDALETGKLVLDPGPDDLRLFGEAALTPPWFSESRTFLGRFRGPATLLASVGLLSALAWAAGVPGDDAPVSEDAVAKHARALPLEIPGPDLPTIEGWARDKVDFNPRVPPLGQGRLRPLGARLSHILDRPAVSLVYGDEAGRRATLFVFAPGSLDLEEEPGHPVRIGRHDVRLLTLRGYNVVLWREGDLGYSLVSDLDSSSLLSILGSPAEPAP